MTRLCKTLTTVCLGTLLLTSVACENKETEDALKTCKNDLSNEQKKEASQQTEINSLKSQLATAQTKIADLTKEAEEAKKGKGGKAMEEKAMSAEAKKGESAKTEKGKEAGKKEKKEKKKEAK